MLVLDNISLKVEENNEQVEILNGINLTLEDRKFYVITGPNGGGKSTLAKVIMGILKPTSGRIYFDGQDITGYGIADRARMGIGYAFQQPPRFKGITVSDIIKLSVGKSKEMSGCNHLHEVGLCPKDYLDREINSSLSGGELKRIEIASILSRDLKIALFDEPEAGIDLWSFTRLTETFRSMHKKSKSTTVIISHQERILDLADEIILLAEGRIQEKGDKSQILPKILNECVCNKDCLEREDVLDECLG